MNTDSKSAQLFQAQTLCYGGFKVGLKLWVKGAFNLFYGNIHVSCMGHYPVVFILIFQLHLFK